MKKILTLFLAVCCFSAPLFGSPVFDLYSDHGVQYAHDCHRTDWLGFYRPLEDKIHLRPSDKYHASYLLNHTALHELGHWSRHSSRLGAIRGPSYMEEIMCDFTAAIIADEMGINREKNREIGRYIDLQLSNHQVSYETWNLVYDDLHQTVEYLLQRPYPKEKIKSYFKDFDALSDEDLARLS